MVSRKPYMDMMAREGFCGQVLTIPDGFPSGSDVACMSIFGYDPAKYYTGRAPIEAYGMGIGMNDSDVAFRCNLVYLEMRADKTIMGDYSGGHITTGEARVLIEDLKKGIGGDVYCFFPGVSYRHIMLWKDGISGMQTTPPHDITGREIAEYLPSGKGADTMIALMKDAQQILRTHPVNKKREKNGLYPANSIWLWGQGKRAHFPSFKEKYNLEGATVAAVDLVKGISSLIGFEAPYVEGATGYIDTDYGAKTRKALELLKDRDVVYIHVEAPDEASHSGNVEEKIKAIESIDRDVVGAVLENTGEDVKCLVVTDHATPLSLKTHYSCPVPFVIFDRRNKKMGCDTGYHEGIGKGIFSGEEMVTFFLKGEGR